MWMVDLGEVPWIISYVLKELSPGVLSNCGRETFNLRSTVKANVSLIGL